MELLQEKREFTNKEGVRCFQTRYFVEVFGRKIFLKPCFDEDKSLLKVGFDNE